MVCSAYKGKELKETFKRIQAVDGTLRDDAFYIIRSIEPVDNQGMVAVVEEIRF